MTDQTKSAASAIGQSKDTNAIPQSVRLPSPFPSTIPLFPLILALFFYFTHLPYQNPSIISSAGAIGKQFNPDGSIGQIGEKIGGPLASNGIIGSQFDASKGGIAGHVERAVDGPRTPAGSDTK
jgi:hypothetical protein